MPRATYDDLLRVAHRWAMAANQNPGHDIDQLTTGWAEVVTATCRHLNWLHSDLPSPELTVDANTSPDYYLQAVARSLGAATDLLATQTAPTSRLLDDPQALSAARYRVAAITTSAAAAVQRGLLAAPATRARQVKALGVHVQQVIAEIEAQPRTSDTPWHANPLSGLATASPPPGTEQTSYVAQLSASWQRAHEEIPAKVLLTRDLRSITAQLRSAGAYAAHFADALIQSGQTAGLEAWMVTDLAQLRDESRQAEAAGRDVAMGWRTRLSDVNGRSDHPGVDRYVVLLKELRNLTMRDGRTVDTAELVTSQRSAYALMSALDELSHASHRIAELQREAVDELIVRGMLFAPITVVARSNPDYRHGNLRYRDTTPGAWVRTSRAEDFTELTASLTAVEQHWSNSAVLAKRVAATTGQLRPYGGSIPSVPPEVRQRFNRDPVTKASPRPEPSTQMTPEAGSW
ncbi:hypothetical protein [Kribbella deserti]|uniref:Uncharacterized protein n=1 Tax=Kribbella deserti TaxID=1926257 RepID=A0ABV6QCR2_9ACTN